jgi:RNA polymerase sigma-70 factor (ECF subfamily)
MMVGVDPEGSGTEAPANATYTRADGPKQNGSLMRRNKREAVNEAKLETFERLCRAEYAGVVRTAYLITGDREEANDVAQEAFARAYERWNSVSGFDRPAAWVQRVAANLAISWRRRRKWLSTAPLPDLGTGGEPNTDAMVVLDALKFLTPAQRAAVVLRYYADQSVEDTARALGKKPGTVRALTSQGVARLREFLSEETVDDART